MCCWRALVPLALLLQLQLTAPPPGAAATRPARLWDRQGALDGERVIIGVNMCSLARVYACTDRFQRCALRSVDWPVWCDIHINNTIHIHTHTDRGGFVELCSCFDSGQGHQPSLGRRTLSPCPSLCLAIQYWCCVYLCTLGGGEGRGGQAAKA